MTFLATYPENKNYKDFVSLFCLISSKQPNKYVMTVIGVKWNLLGVFSFSFATFHMKYFLFYTKTVKNSNKVHLSELKICIFTHSAAWAPSIVSQYSLQHLLRLSCLIWASLHLGRSIFLVSPPDDCFACSATADRYSAPCVWRGRHHRWNNNCPACLYRAVSQLVQATQEAQCRTIIYDNTASGEQQKRRRAWETRCLTDVHVAFYRRRGPC